MSLRISKPSARWEFMRTFRITGSDGSPYLTRLRIVQTPLFGIYLHTIHRPDEDRHLHDHPWNFISLVLSGAYSENRSVDRFSPRLRKRWSVARFRAEDAHEIFYVTGPNGHALNGPNEQDVCRTLVLVGRRRRDWGFHTEDGWVLWSEYLGVAS
jgi:hypothetical protein